MLLHEADAVEFIYQIMVAKDHKHTLYQLSSGEKMSRYELAQAVAAGMENEVSIVEEENKNTGKLCFPVKDTMKNLEAVCFIMQEQMWKRLRLISADMYLNLQMQGRKGTSVSKIRQQDKGNHNESDSFYGKPDLFYSVFHVE